jgi:hypothetical protein
VTAHKQIARSVVWLAAVAAVAAVGALGACGSSPTPLKNGKAGAGGKAGASGGAGTTGAAGDTSGTAGGAAGASSTGEGGATPTMIGTTGGTVSASDVTLTIPADALTGDTPITIATTTSPGGYTLASMAYQFGPSGTTFAQPVLVQIPLSAPTPGAHLFWSNASGGFDDLGGMVSGMTLTGMVTHFSIGFAAVPTTTTAHDGGAGTSGADASASGAAGNASGAAGTTGAAGATASDGGAGAPGADASAGADAAAGSGGGSDSGAGSSGAAGGTADASAPIDAASLCASYALNAPVFQPTLITDGGAAPDGTTYSGGTLGSGQYYLSAVTHYGSSYGGPNAEVFIYDASAHTMRIIDRIQAVQFYIGLENVRNADAHTLVGDVVCNTYPNQGNVAQMSWYYTVGQKLVLQRVGSSDVQSYTIALAP